MQPTTIDIATDVPDGMTLRQWHAAIIPARRSWWARIWTRFEREQD